MSDDDHTSTEIVTTDEWRNDLEANSYWNDKPTARASMLMVLDQVDALQKDLLTAHLMVAKDASDAPSRISYAIRPFLAGAVERHGITPDQNGSKGTR